MRAMDLGIDGKVALVTAASAGLGFGCAQALVGEGCRVAINGHDAGRLDAARAALGAYTLALPADVTDPGAPAQLVTSTVERFGGIDILVANAPGPPKARALDVTDDALRDAIEANLLTSVRLVRAAVPHMRTAGGGAIVNISSVSAFRGSAERPTHAYAASKGAVLGLTHAMAASYGRDRIRVNAICPGTIRTRLTVDIVPGVEKASREGRGIPLGRVGEPEDIARCALFLASDDASFISGAHIVADGGAMAASM